MKRRALFAAVFSICVGWLLTVRASDPSERFLGNWSLNNWTSGDSVNLKLGYKKGGTSWQWSSDQPLDGLQGLTRDQMHDIHASAAFTLKRDAGTFAFEGSILMGLGRGSYRFVPDPSYKDKLTALGFDTEEEDDVSIMMLAVRDVSLAFATEVKQSGLSRAGIQDLVRLRDHGIEPNYVARIHAAGFDNISVDDVIKLHDHGID